jgi:hypothetical protein
MSKKKRANFDQLETFFIAETSKLICLYDQIKSSDPRSETSITGEVSSEDELSVVKHSWAVLISYAQLYGYKRFSEVNPDIEKFYLEKINV